MVLHDRVKSEVAEQMKGLTAPVFGNIVVTIQLDYHQGKAVGHQVDAHVHAQTRY